MILADLPHDEELRLQDLYAYDILDTQYESDFDELVELASQICKCPISLISLVDRERQWFKAKTGLDVKGTSRDVAFCSHTILQDGIMQVEDAKQDMRFHDNPLVTGDLNMRFYAGLPIVSPTGHKVGTLCLIDHKPKTLSPEEERAMKLLANQASKLLEMRRNNKQLCERSEEIINLKSHSIKRLVEDAEDSKQEISYKLHEDIAQTIAASMFYLQAAEDVGGQNIEFVSKARLQLQKGLDDIRNLSYGIVPPSLHLLSPHALVDEYLGKTASTRQLTAKLLPANKPVQISNDQLLFLLRLAGNWLTILDKHTGARNVIIALSNDSDVLLEMKDDGGLNIEAREKLLRQHALIDTVRCFHGALELLMQNDGTHLLRISMPDASNPSQQKKNGNSEKERTSSAKSQRC